MIAWIFAIDTVPVAVLVVEVPSTVPGAGVITVGFDISVSVLAWMMPLLAKPETFTISPGVMLPRTPTWPLRSMIFVALVTLIMNCPFVAVPVLVDVVIPLAKIVAGTVFDERLLTISPFI